MAKAYEKQQWSKDGVVDWSKGPADATHYVPESDEDYESFLKVEGDDLYFTNVKRTEWTLDQLNDPDGLTDSKFIVK